MLELQQILLLVKFFNQISCNKSLKGRISYFSCVFFCLPPCPPPPPPPPQGWNVLAAERSFHSWHHTGWRNTKIWIHRASQIEQKHGKCWKLPIFELNCMFFSVIWMKWKQSASSITLPYSSTFYTLFLSFFVLEIFKFKDDKFFVRHSASIFEFKWSEQPSHSQTLEAAHKYKNLHLKIRWSRENIFDFQFHGQIFTIFWLTAVVQHCRLDHSIL